MEKIKQPTQHQADLRESFYSRELTEQRDILFSYTIYVADYPDDHDEGSYPASFWEWFEHDSNFYEQE